MEEQRKKFGMELLPSLHRRLKQLALDQDRQLWAIFQEAIEQYLDGVKATDEDDPDLARVRYILEHSQRIVGFRSAIDLFYSDTKANPRPRQNDKPKRKAG